MRIHSFLLFAVIIIPAWSCPAMAAEGNYGCPVTTAPNPPFVPPAPYWPNTSPGSFWYGTNGLWTSLRIESNWPKGGEKLFLWEQGYDWRTESRPDIQMVSRRLDTRAPLVTSRGGTNAIIGHVGAMLTGVAIPTEGCWEITAKHGGHVLTFIVSVLP
jgi:hypothetical protein